MNWLLKKEALTFSEAIALIVSDRNLYLNRIEYAGNTPRAQKRKAVVNAFRKFLGMRPK